LGYAELDAVIRGVAPGEVMQVLGRSGVGKTAFGLNLVERMTADGQLPTLIFSLEMPGVELFERMASMSTGWAGREIEDRARMEDPQVSERFVEVCQGWQHVVTVERSCTLAQLDDLITAARASDLWPAPLRLVVVDYLGLIVPRRTATPYEQTSESAKELKCLAKRHQVGIVSLCQVGREGESGGEPITLKSARDSGVVEEAADYLLGIWRPELSDRLSKDERAGKRGEFKVRVLKNRSGPAPKTVTLRFEPTTLRIRPVLPVSAEPVPAWVEEE
jgi:replicative DNA helicase